MAATPIPSSVTKSFDPRGPLQQHRLADTISFRCFRCGGAKKSRLVTTYSANWDRKLCNGCYGHLLRIYEICANSTSDSDRIERLTAHLLDSVSIDDQRRAESLLRTRERRAEKLSPDAMQFVATAESTAGFLRSRIGREPFLELSPAIVGLCKAVEAELITRVFEPIAGSAAHLDLSGDKKDGDFAAVARYCAGGENKPPELGTAARFLHTIANSKNRRSSSPLVRHTLSVATRWPGSTWILAPDGLYSSLTTLANDYRNPSAHTGAMNLDDYLGCQDLTIGKEGLLWRLIDATEVRR